MTAGVARDFGAGETGEAEGLLVPLPALVKGELVYPELPSAGDLERLLDWHARGRGGARPGKAAVVDGCYLVPLPAETATRDGLHPTGFVAFPRVRAEDLVETDLDGLVRGLFNLPFDDVLEYLGALARVVADPDSWSRAVAGFMREIPGFDRRNVELAVTTLPHLLRPESVREAVDRELGDAGAQYLDGWVSVATDVHAGPTARTAEAEGLSGEARRPRPRLRGMPTRQLHITAGNSVMTPLISAVRAFATKGAAVVKTTAATAPAMTVVAHALREAGSDHPLVRHTSIVYWPGGDEDVEDVLFAKGAFDRIVAWGSEATIASVASRAHAPKLTLFRPRVGMSLVGREVFAEDLAGVAGRAVTDVMIDNQHACTSSLVHYVEGSEEQVLSYCRALQHALASWDRAVPARPSRPEVGGLRRLRRGELAGGVWFENTAGRLVTSAVVYMSQEIDLSAHPMCRLVVVRRVDDLGAALRYVDDSVAAVGVYPDERRLELRDRLAVRGVSNVCALGRCDRAYAGIPHDGVRPLHELVNWISE